MFLPDLVVRSRRVVAANGTRAAAIHVRTGRVIGLLDFDDVPKGCPVDDAGDAAVIPGGGSIEKVGRGAIIVANTGVASEGFAQAGGTYVLVGSWQTPERDGSRITFSPALSPAEEPLMVQAILIRFGTGNDLSKALRHHFDAGAMAQKLPLAP